MDAQAAEAAHLLPVYAQLPIEPVAGDGVWLTLRDGRRLLDLYGGHAVALVGYRHPRLLAALARQAEDLFFQSNVVPLDVRARAARRLAAFAPEGLSRVFLVNSGAEANENALRLALRFGASGRAAADPAPRPPARNRVVALEGAFHGRTAAAGAVTHGAAERWYGFPRPPFDVTFVPRDDAAALEAAMGEDVAALIVEPVQGIAGAVALAPAFLEAARRVTREVGALLIFDEVQCGMGRTGWPFAAQRAGVSPDLLTAGKGLAGGFPAGAVLATAEVAAGVAVGDLGSTFGGGPMACALIEAVIDVIEGQGLLERVRRLSARLARECRVGPVEGVQGAGYLLGLRTSRPAKEVQAELLARGLLAGGSADPRVVRLLPPLTLEDEHVDALVQALAEIPA